MDEALDIQHDPDPAHEVPPARRIPHLGHALLYLSLNAFCLLLAGLVTASALHITDPSGHPIANALAELAGYILTFAIAIPVFPLIWDNPFFHALSWNPRPAQLHWVKLTGIALALSISAELAGRFVKTPADSTILLLFKTPASAWTTAILGSLVPAFAEEVAFRGFLLPALATAYDWLALDRTPAALDRWTSTNNITTGAWIFGTTFSSLAFALLHGAQDHWSPGTLVILFCVSLGFSAVRIRYRSLAAATLVHAVYDALLFAEMAVLTGGFRHLDKLL